MPSAHLTILYPSHFQLLDPNSQNILASNPICSVLVRFGTHKRSQHIETSLQNYKQKDQASIFPPKPTSPVGMFTDENYPEEAQNNQKLHQRTGGD